MTRVALCHSCVVPSNFGQIKIIWRVTDSKLVRIFLPRQLRLFGSSAYKSAITVKVPNGAVGRACQKISTLLRGKPVGFDLNILDWSVTSGFQKGVLLTENRIPRGMVSTYGRIAERIDKPGAARAVGNALATNPFPLIIPCHRAIRTDGSLGGYAGGIDMKKKLLELEGIEFDNRSRVVIKKIW